MNTKKRNIHRGELLESAVAKSHISISKLTKRMGISRGTFYNHKSNPDLSYDLLERYGKILNYDFTQDLPSMRKYSFEEPEVIYATPKNLKEAIDQKNYWKDRYYKLLEQFNQLLLERK